VGYICIHCHFYQPPRENPWLEAIELQDSAHPYHDWNERITAECYAPNTASRILDSENWIVKILSNYTKISFDFGPTLLSWMETKAREVYQKILEADRRSYEQSGHGSALAQAYNHMIMPLANRRDKQTQVQWGIRDFEYRFKRHPEGMWLPETAVDLETLEILAGQGIRFTILDPRQARRVRKMGGRTWQDVSGGRIDPTRAYRLRLPSRRVIKLFFYDGPVSSEIAFNGLLSNGEQFAQRLIGLFSAERTWPELVNIATDGETYGHHHPHGDMGLAYALHYIESNGLAKITNYGEYLEKHPATHEVEIFENTSWSCAHGVERWRSDCGCNTGKGWNQQWRTPLRESMDWLRDALAPLYEEAGSRLLKDPWAARSDYISVILNRSPERIDSFLAKHSRHRLSETERISALRLLEMQRHAMLMYTSCGWFFDELSGLETVQVIQYAGRAIQLAQELGMDPIERMFVERLASAKSNIPEHRDGAVIYDKFVRPAMVTLPKLGAHYAISSVFTRYEEQSQIYCYKVNREDYQKLESGSTILVVGKAHFASIITGDSALLMFAVLSFAGHNLAGGVIEFQSEEKYQHLAEDLAAAFSQTDLPELIRILDRGFEKKTYSLKSLFRDEQYRILGLILEAELTGVEASYEQIYDARSSLMHYIAGLDVPLPAPFHKAAEFTINARLRRLFDAADLDLEQTAALLKQAKTLGVPLDAKSLEYTLRKNIETMAEQWSAAPHDLASLLKLEAATAVLSSLPFKVNLWKAQNICFEIQQDKLAAAPRWTFEKHEEANEWVNHFQSLTGKLGIRVLELPKPSDAAVTDARAVGLG
jgi:alpha-amylase/alpha-mannosidase (GH57 family)